MGSWFIMWYWDYAPSSSHRAKPLTKKQLAKAREAYAKADMITAQVKALEAKEEKDAAKELEKLEDFS
jgi:hypothetical protein